MSSGQQALMTQVTMLTSADRRPAFNVYLLDRIETSLQNYNLDGAIKTIKNAHNFIILKTTRYRFHLKRILDVHIITFIFR